MNTVSLQHAWPLIGNRPRLAELEADLQSGTVNHAYLLAGPAEIGKLTAARYFAQLLLCESGAACGACESCRQVRSLVHPGLTIADTLWVEGVSEDWEELGKESNYSQLHRSKTPKAKTDTLGIEDVAEITARLHNTHDTWQVIIIARVERLSIPAVNSLLKILEEPPPRTVFLLTTDTLGTLLPTLTSRCRVSTWVNVSPSEIQALLAAKASPLSEVERQRVAMLATGKPGRALRLAADPDRLREYEEYFRQIKNLIEKPNRVARLQLAESAAASSAEAAQLLEVLTYFLRSFLLTRVRAPVTGSRYDAARLATLLQRTEAARRLLQKNVNTRLVLEDLLLEL
jgi:DNA polymerase-3 subunit delta'